MNSILYLAEVGFNNAGDEVMWDIFKRQAHKHLNMAHNKLEVSPAAKANINPYNLIVLGGGSLIAPSYISKLDEALLQNKPTFIWGSGIDRMINKTGLEYIMGKSPIQPNRPSQETIDKLANILDKACFAAVRGPFSYSFLQHLNLDVSNVVISGDPAFILNPKDAANFSVNRPALTEDKVVGINWGTANNKIFGGNEAFVEDQLASVAKELIKRGYSVLLFVMCPEDITSAQRLLTKIGEQSKVQLIKTVNPYEVMTIIKCCHFTINIKLHASILSAVMRVPFIALGYRFKVFDFAASINSLQYVISTDSPIIHNKILELSDLLEKDYSTITKLIDDNLKKYQNTLTRPFFEKIQECGESI